MQMVNTAAYSRIRGNYFMYERKRVAIKQNMYCTFIFLSNANVFKFC